MGAHVPVGVVCVVLVRRTGGVAAVAGRATGMYAFVVAWVRGVFATGIGAQYLLSCAGVLLL